MAQKISRYLKIISSFKWTILLFTFGLFTLSIGFSFFLVFIYRAINLQGSWQQWAATITLQPLPHLYRALILSLFGVGIMIFTLQMGGKRLLRPFVREWDSFFDQVTKHDLRSHGPNVVIIGGGIGTAQLIRGLKKFAGRLSVVVHMTDDGGSTGRLRRALGTPAFGDIVSNIVALSDTEDLLKDLLLYRFKGERYGKDTEIGGHKLGNLMFAALGEITGDLNQAISKVSEIFAVRGLVLPVSLENVHLCARTSDGVEVRGEENIDLGKYEGEKVLTNIWYEPKEAKVNPKVLEIVKEADIIVLGPGDLYTTILSDLIFADLVKAITDSQAFKAYILNVANKPFETRGYKLIDFIEAFRRHGAELCFRHIFVNSNHEIPIPTTPEYEGYNYVEYDKTAIEAMGYHIIEGDFLEEYMGGVEGKGVSIYHDPDKIATALLAAYEKQVWSQ